MKRPAPVESPPVTACRVVNLLQGLFVGGMEKGVLQQVQDARREGHDDRILLFDRPWTGSDAEFDPGDVPVHVLSRRPGFDWRFAWRLGRLMRCWSPGIIHARNQTALFYAALATRFLGPHRPRLAVTFHTAPAQSAWKARIASSWAAGQADCVAVVSRELGERLQGEGWIDEYHTIHNGVDVGRYRPDGPTGGWRARLGVSPQAFVIGHVGRFDTNKRQMHLVEAFREVRQLRPSAVLWLVGQGDCWHDVRRAVSGEPGIFLVPRVHAMEPFLRELNAFVICSRHEGLPRALLEAMATARAVVATRVGGVPELLETGHGSCGLLVDPDSVPELAGALLSLFDGGRRASLGARARERVQGHFSNEHCFAAYSRLYAEILGQDSRLWRKACLSPTTHLRQRYDDGLSHPAPCRDPSSKLLP